MRNICIIFVLIFRIIVAQLPDITFTIFEELSMSTTIGSLYESQHLFQDLSERHASGLRFGILDQGSSPASFFNITSTEGILFVARRIDREALCPLLENCVLKVNILASVENASVFESRVITAHIKILDTNDNFPTFKKKSEIAQISEGSPPGTITTFSGAIDLDFVPEHKITVYRLNNFRDTFSLSASKTLDGSSEIHLSLTKPIDRESVSKYEFSITAYDQESPAVESKLFVTLVVVDQNDNEPTFSNTTYYVVIDSKLMPGELILQVSATDADDGDNALITYDFSSMQKQIMDNMFRINSTTGEIFNIGGIRSDVSEFIVVASDSGSPQLKTQAVVKVNIVNAGNTAPKVTLATVGENSGNQSVVSVLEPGGRGFFVAFVLVDDDGPEHVLCQINSNVFLIVPVAKKGYKIVLLSAVDFEVTPYYDLEVICTDKGDLPLNTTLQFRVNIQDANDNAPVFSQRRYSRSISEGWKNGEYVLQVSAVDLDSGLNGMVRYSLDTDFDRLFKIEPNTGVISAVGDLDRELYLTLAFKVYASDQGDPEPKISSAEVVVDLEDVNDNFPEFNFKVFTIQTLEEVTGERIVGNLVAKDADEGVNGQLEYFFTGSVDGADLLFTVHKNGSIVCVGKLDREMRANYSFSVIAKDMGSPSLSTTAVVVVEVVDVNDNTPTIIFPKSQNYTITILTVPETGCVLGRVVASDDDDDENGRLKFAIVSGNDDRAFEISESTGELKVERSLNLKNNKEYNVCIIVSDSGTPVRSKTTCLTIEVLIGGLSQGLIKLTNGSKEDYVIVISAVGAVTVVFSTLVVVSIWIFFKRGKTAEMALAPQRSLNDVACINTNEKVTNVSPQNRLVSHHKEYHQSNLTSPSLGEYDKSKRSGIYIPNNHIYPGCDNTSPKRKSVSFVIEGSQKVSPTTPHVVLWNDLQPFLTFSPSSTRSRDEAYPESLVDSQSDDVTSDTSGDSMTTDSGRGNSVDDITSNQSPKRDHIGNSPTGGCSNKTHRYSYTKNQPDRHKTSQNHFRFIPSSGKSHPSEVLQTQKQPINYNRACAHVSSKPIKMDTKCGNSAHKVFLYTTNRASNRQSHTGTPGVARQISATPSNNVSTITTTGSYNGNQGAVRIEPFVGTDIFV